MGPNDDSKLSSANLRKLLFFYLAGALLLLVIALALSISFVLIGYLKKAEDKNILHAAQTRAMTIAEWCRRSKDVAWQITSRSRIRQELEEYNQGRVSLEEVNTFTEPKLKDAMNMSKDIIGILRLDRSNHLVAACGNSSVLPMIKETLQDFSIRDAVVLEPFTVSGKLYIVVTAPIVSRNGKRQGTDIVLFATDGLSAIATDSKPIGNTSRIIVGYRFNEEIAHLFPIKTIFTDSLSKSDPSSKITALFEKALAGNTGIEKISDILVAYTPVKESSWGLIVTQDEKELYYPLYRKIGNIGILFLLMYMLTLFGFGFVMKPLAGKILLHADDLENKIQEKTWILEKEINRRTKAEDLLREKERFLASIFDSIQDGISVLTPDLKIVHTNKAMQAWYAEHTPLEGKTCFEIYRGLKQPCENCPTLKAITNQKLEMQEVPLLQVGKETGVLEVYAFPMVDDDGIVTGAVEYIRDVTKRKMAERALADSERQLSDIIEFLPDPTWVIDKDGHVIAWNLAMERLSGIKKIQIIGKGDYAYAVPFYGKPRPLLIDLVLKRDKKWESNFLTFKDKDGILIESESYHPSMGDGGRYFASTAGRLYDAQGSVVGAIETIRDITHTKRTEQEREKLISELKEALEKVRTLSGLLPICAKCKKIRDDKGYWSQLETYISHYTDANFSHGLCPECMDAMYGGQSWYERGKQKGRL